MSEKFWNSVVDRADIATRKISDRVVEFVIREIEVRADSPEDWPLNLDVSDITKSPRVLQDAVKKLEDGYGITSAQAQKDGSILVPLPVICREEEDEGEIEEPAEEEVLLQEESLVPDIILAEDASALAQNSSMERLIKSYEYVDKRIKDEAVKNNRNVTLVLSKPPISKDMWVVQRVIKKLSRSGYKVTPNIDNGIMVKLLVEWP